MADIGKTTSVHPAWLDTIVPSEYEDEGLYEIILFFVIHSPCNGQSSKGISLTERGWKAKPWYSPKYLKEKLDKVIFGESPKKLKMVDSKCKLLPEIKKFDLDDDYFNHRESHSNSDTMVSGRVGFFFCTPYFLKMPVFKGFLGYKHTIALSE